MAGLLTGALRQTASAPATGRPAGPAWARAAVAGLLGTGLPLLGCLVVALAGWFGSDAGAHGDTRAALRVGADAWLLGHGSGLILGDTRLTAVPLGITVVSLLTLWRTGRRAGRSAAGRPAASVALAVAVLVAVAGMVAALTAVLASTPAAQPQLGRAILGTALAALVAGGGGFVVGSGLSPAGALPAEVRLALRGAVAMVLLLVAASSVLVAAALLVDLGSAANVLARLRVDVGAGLLYTVVVAAAAPNAVLLGVGYLLGPGFAVGTGTVVSPTAVEIGPVPAFPLLAALPGTGTPPWWTTALLAVPALAATLGAVLALRRRTGGRLSGALLGLGAGLLGAVLATLCVAAAGGAVGPGRMADVGAEVLPVLGYAAVSLGAGGALGGLVLGWWEGRAPGSDRPPG